MKLEEVLEIVGTFGWYQKSAFMMMILPAMFSGIFMLMPVIILADRHHRCTLPGYIGDTYHVQNSDHEALVEEMIPSRGDREMLYEPCHIRLSVNGFLPNSTLLSVNSSTMMCSNWVYDKSVFNSTFASQRHIQRRLDELIYFVPGGIITVLYRTLSGVIRRLEYPICLPHGRSQNLVCEKAHLVPFAMMVFYIGVFVGGIVFGFISDRIGRKKTLFTSILLLLVTNLLLTAVNDFALFSFINFLIGTSVSGTLLTAYVLSVELLESTTRLAASSVYKGVFAIGSSILAVVSYLIRDWVYIEIAVSIPLIICFTYYRRVDESVRWLIAEGRIDEAENILRKAAKMNGNVLLEVEIISKEPTNQNGACKSKEPIKRHDKENISSLLDPHPACHEEGKVWHLFHSRKLSIRTLIVFYLWFGFGLVYYGLTMNTDNLGHNFYLSFALAGLSELPAYVLMVLLDKYGQGRKSLLMTFFMLSGITCICAAVTTLYDIPIATLTLAMIGKLGSAGACATVYLYTNEVMPTVVRNAGFGTSASFARLGTVAAPYIIDMNMRVPGRIGAAIPLFTFGGVSVLCAMVTVFLPETVNRELPETLKDAENMDTHLCHAS